MSENAVQYLKENREKYPQEVLARKLREAGYAEEDVSESVKIVFGGEDTIKPLTRKAKADKVADKIGKAFVIIMLVILGLAILPSFLGSPWGNERIHGRDAKRISDVKQLQAGLELYYDSCGSYPIVSNTTPIGSPSFDISFHEGCPEGTSLGIFINPLPVNPTPGGEPYAYYGSREIYAISFSLEKKAGNLSAGKHFATPQGIQ